MAGMSCTLGLLAHERELFVGWKNFGGWRLGSIFMTVRSPRTCHTFMTEVKLDLRAGHAYIPVSIAEIGAICSRAPTWL